MLLGHNWVANGSFLERQESYNSAIRVSDYTSQESGRKWVIIHRKGRKERKAVQQESLHPLRSFLLNVFSAPAHERAPPAVHPRSGRAGG